VCAVGIPQIVASVRNRLQLLRNGRPRYLLLGWAIPLALCAAGDLDPSFGRGGKVLTDFASASDDYARAVVLQPNGRIVAAGLSNAAGRYDFALARYNRDGTLDETFGSGGTVLTNFGGVEDARAVALRPNGKIVAAGLSDAAGSSDFALARYHRDGTLDPTFGSGGMVLTDFGSSGDQAFAVAILPNGGIVAAGLSNAAGSDDFALARYNRDGSLHQAFGSGGLVLTDFGFDDAATAIALQPNGQIVAAGRSFGMNGSDFALARYNRDGSLDQAFGSGGMVLTDFGAASFDGATAVALQPNGKIVAAGMSDAAGSFDFALARYNRDGSLDTSFGNGGMVLTDFGFDGFDSAYAVAVLPNGQIVAAGVGVGGPDPATFAIARYGADGSLDGSFGTDGLVLTPFTSASFSEALAVAVQPNGRIVAAGRSNPGGVNYDFALTRYLAR